MGRRCDDEQHQAMECPTGEIPEVNCSGELTSILKIKSKNNFPGRMPNLEIGDLRI